MSIHHTLLPSCLPCYVSIPLNCEPKPALTSSFPLPHSLPPFIPSFLLFLLFLFLVFLHSIINLFWMPFSKMHCNAKKNCSCTIATLSIGCSSYWGRILRVAAPTNKQMQKQLYHSLTTICKGHETSMLLQSDISLGNYKLQTDL